MSQLGKRGEAPLASSGGRGAGKHPVMHRTDLITKNSVAPNASSIEVMKNCLIEAE